MDIRNEVRKMKEDSPAMAALSLEIRNQALADAAAALTANREEIFAANRADMDAAKESGVAPAVMKRLKFDEKKLTDVIEGIADLIRLPDPLSQVQLCRELDEGLTLQRVTCPIGVIGIIFEARPDALVQISALCIKSGNCAVLKGGKETSRTNKVLFNLIYKAVTASGLPKGCMLQAEQHNEIDELLSCHDCVDLLIPRGSNQFVQYIMNNTKIPVMGHADGVCHIYADEFCDLEKAIPILVDAKTQYTAACNAVETLLVHRRIAGDFLPAAAKALTGAGVKLRGTKEAADIISCEVMGEEEFDTEYLNLVLSVKLVDSLEEAVAHINRFGSHHTDCILTENQENALKFMQLTDSAGVYQNCSTRFADGFRYGFGAEVGISTGKIHARGPVGLEGLVTYKYKLFGSGQIVGDYASGKKSFHFKNLDAISS
ncbi:glutamate-5-semialdehyde dehydrogenase [Anaerotruncus sp. 1XD22-93]|nr:glutamate-5-semialdehyde dehydrogenase [Lachnospiraceae bacterium]NBI73870.1 glutamate-5-semialdehyde dehydrogenase [Lachnospiraceae bacterium]RKK00836.1 glutamate-5-semialdehyde dehydrogenase [Anaerotruncus sp. 1XD22-93]